MIKSNDHKREIQKLKDDLSSRSRQLQNMRVFDELTGMASRQMLTHKLTHGSGQKALIVADICRLGAINSVYGTMAGDAVLAAAAAALREICPKNAETFRFAGDQFVFLIDDPQINEAEALAAKILATASESKLIFERIEIKISMAVGLAYGKHSTLINHAMSALQEAKMLGSNRFVRHNNHLESHRRQKNNLYWLPRLKRALQNGEIQPWFQPIIDNKTGFIEKYECLARLTDEKQQVIDPYFFLEAAEVSGILTAITKTILAQSFAYFEGKNTHFSINITDSDLQEGYLPEAFAFRLKKHNLSAEQVTLEIVESVSAVSVNKHIDQLMGFQQMGFLIAADDFGSEHSNFSRLLSLDLDYIKIDGAFVRNALSDPRSKMVVKNMVEFSKSIGAQTIAEYVSTPEIFKIIKELGVDYSQGFLFGKPQPTIDFSVDHAVGFTADFIADHTTDHTGGKTQ